MMWWKILPCKLSYHSIDWNVFHQFMYESMNFITNTQWGSQYLMYKVYVAKKSNIWKMRFISTLCMKLKFIEISLKKFLKKTFKHLNFFSLHKIKIFFKIPFYFTIMVWNPSVTCREVSLNGCWEAYHILEKIVLCHLKREFYPQYLTSLACFQQESY